MYNFEKLIEDMRTSAAKELLSLIGVSAIYNLKNLKVYENVIKKAMILDLMPFYVSHVISGFFLGETIVKNIKGSSWNYEDCFELNEVSIDIPVDKSDGEVVIQVYPFGRAEKFLFSPEEYDFVEYYKMIEKMKKKKVSLFNQPDGKWVNHGQIQSRTFRVG